MKRTDQLTKNFNQASSASQRRAFPSTWPDLGNPCPQDLHNSKVTKDLARSFNSASIECTKQECRKFERAGHSILDGWMSFDCLNAGSNDESSSIFIDNNEILRFFRNFKAFKEILRDFNRF